MASYYKHKKAWVVSYRLAGRPREYVYGIRTERVARQTKAAKDVEEQLVKVGLHTPRPNAAKIDAAELKPIADHVDNFERSIVQRGKEAQHARQTASLVRRLLKAAGVHRVSQIEAEPDPGRRQAADDDGGRAPRTANAASRPSASSRPGSTPASAPSTDVLHRRLQTYNEAVDQRRRRRGCRSRSSRCCSTPPAPAASGAACAAPTARCSIKSPSAPASARRRA
jgi:hypothetical protein